MEVTSVKEKQIRLMGQQSLSFRYLVKMDGTSGWVEFEIISKQGGTDKKRINISIGN